MPTGSVLVPATAESGYVLSPDPLANPFTSDLSLQRILAWYLPQEVLRVVSRDLTKFGDEAVSEQIQTLVANAERNQPYVKTHNVWGRRYDYDRLVTSEGWKELGKWGFRNGVVAKGYEPDFGDYRRIVQHATNYIYSASAGLYSCPTSMTSGAARLLTLEASKVPPSHPFHEILSRVLSREGYWTSAQWMTERPGGSDVQNTETIAMYSPLPKKTGEFGAVDEGDYLVTGFKFFSSATDSNIAFMLAKTDSGKLSLFIAPTRKTVVGPDGQKKQVTNGVRIHRLKNKMGTKQLPTAELELKDVRAHMIGPMDRGVPTIANLLNVSRSHNFITSASFWRRSMAIAKSFAKARTTVDQPLWLFPMHLRLFAEMEVKHRGAQHLCFFTTSLISFTENAFPTNVPVKYAPLPSPGEEAKVVVRALTATAKAVVCKVSVFCIQECQESMGGVGYMDEPDEPEFNISRLYRDAAANVIWEGTTNVLASELVRHLLNGRNLEVFGDWLNRSISTVKGEILGSALKDSWSTLYRRLARNKDHIASALADGRQIMFSLAWVVCGVLLALDAQRDDDEVAKEVAKRWVLDAEGGVGEFVLADVVHVRSQADTKKDEERAKWDCRLAWGVELPQGGATGYRNAAKASLISSKL